MRIIIGGAGRVGTDLAKALRAEDIDVVLVDSEAIAALALRLHEILPRGARALF